MGRGDVLAAGGKSATFFPAKTVIKNAAPFVSSADLDAVSEEKSESHLPALVDNSALFKKTRMQFKGKPRRDMVSIRRIEKDMPSAIIIPDVAKGKSEIGRIASVGPDVKDLKEGDLVLFDRYAAVGGEIDLSTEDGEKQHLIMREYDVMLTLEPITETSDSVS